MVCKNCGAQIAERSLFCAECGKSTGINLEPSKPVSKGKATIFVVLGVIFSAVAIVFLPPVFGGIGVAMGYQTKKAGKNKLGIGIMVLAIVCGIIGMILGALAYMNQQ